MKKFIVKEGNVYPILVSKPCPVNGANFYVQAEKLAMPEHVDAKLCMHGSFIFFIFFNY